MDKDTDRGTERQASACEMNELLQELRVILPGVQVLFAFLLTVVFSQRFTALEAYQKDIYFTALLSMAFATIFFIAPTSQHRLLWHTACQVVPEAAGGQRTHHRGVAGSGGRGKLRGVLGVRLHLRGRG